ncbi:hypothetical protein AB0C07_14630 [Actinoplanes missouriensis]|uniref:hypothetical protein n=1 Tax=Actinoplanes missouriensis TaxID=1866 RepID=UPI003409998C
MEAKAAALLDVLHELVNAIDNPRWRSAAQAAFRLPQDRYVGREFDSVAGRWRHVAQAEDPPYNGSDDALDRYRGYWLTAAHHLAKRLDERVRELNRAGGWEKYRKTEPHIPAATFPISFDRTDVLYRFKGRQGIQSISYRWLTAHDEVDHYEAVGWYYNEPDAPVQIEPLANCVLDGPLTDLPQGGRSGRLRFSRRLRAGDKYFFAYSIHFGSERPCRPTILYEVRGLSMRALTVRAQFDPAELPAMCWYFDLGVQVEAARPPDSSAPEVLEIAPNGFVDHEFLSCEQGRKYGLRWTWDEE